MSWSDFTIENIKHFKNNKINIDKSNQLLIAIKNERTNIKNFIQRNNLYITINQLDDNELKTTNKKIFEYSGVQWVDSKNLNSDFDNLDKTYKLTWKTPIERNINPNLVKNIDNKLFIKTTEKNIKKIVKRLKFLIYVGEYLKYKSNNTNKVFDIYIVLSNLKRFFPESKQKIQVTHVNGGYTDFYKNIIFVWRHEEFEKVLLHEMIHFFDMDSRDVNFTTKIKINGPTSFYEAKTDFYAIFYHLIYLSVVTRLSIKNLLEIELSFVENQAMALNAHFNLGSWNYKTIGNINQTTPAMSYYIFKYMLFKYFMENKLNELNDYDQVLTKILRIGFVQKPFIKLESSRMSLLQLH
jgi:hypothetical protein